MIRVAINGFGRIGRLTTRRLMMNKEVSIVAINDLTDNPTLAHLFKYDTAYGKFDGHIAASEDYLEINDQKIKAFATKDPSTLPWKDLGVDVVIESTGVFTSTEHCMTHIQAGARKVALSAPAKGPMKTIVIGVNENTLTTSDMIVSNASCTTNCLAPMVKVLDDAYGIAEGFMTTVHAFTQDQKIQDSPHRDLRRARAASYNIIPTTTGAAEAVALVMPHLKGKLTGSALRVPVITGSLTEFTCLLNKPTNVTAINELFKQQSETAMKGILEYSTDPLVSSDIIGNSYSCIFDSECTKQLGAMYRILGWYDNEYGYSSRLANLVSILGQL